MYAKASFAICLLAAVATLGVEFLLDGYRPTTHWSDFVAIAFAVSPYLVLALIAWAYPAHQAASTGVQIATVLLAVGGLSLTASEWFDYDAAITQSPKGAQYMSVRYQRIAIFVVPVAQWLGALALGIVLLRVRLTSRCDAPDVSSSRQRAARDDGR